MTNKKVGYGARIKAARESQRPKKMSQAALQAACGWKNPENGNSRIANYEAETREPSINDIIKIAKALGEDPAVLAFGYLMADANKAKLVEAYDKASDQGREYLLDSAELVLRKYRR